MKRTLMLALLCATACAAVQAAIPTNPAVTQATIGQTICVPGWTATVRPPVAYTNKLKKALMKAAGIPWSQADQYELDHDEPLALGGAPRDPANLKLQPWPEAKIKDKLEVKLKKLVCAGKMQLSDAQACIYSDWRACSTKLKVK